MILKVHHIAIICSNYRVSKTFYTDIIGLTVLAETYRADRQSFKLDLAIDGIYCIELFSFPSPPPRKSYPEATGLRHIAFAVDDINERHAFLSSRNTEIQAIRLDEQTGKRFFFIWDPDGLPIEFYEN